MQPLHVSPVGCCEARWQSPVAPSPPAQVTIGVDPTEVFAGADWCLMVGAKPRGPGMERADLLQQNGEIFQIQ